MKMCTRDIIIEFLINERGAIETHSSSRKFRRFEVRRPHGEPLIYWVGKRGQVRGGRTVSSSLCITDTVKANALTWWEDNHGPVR